MPQPLMAVVVAAVRPLTPRITEYQLAAADGRALAQAEPGAHVRLHLGDAATGPLVRHYSLVGSDPGDPPDTAGRRWRIAVQRHDHGGASAHLHAHWVPGTLVHAAPPAQAFALAGHAGHNLLVAGGIGITPILPMLRSLVRRRRSVSIAYTGRDRPSMAYHDEVLALAGSAAVLHYTGQGDSGQGARLNLPALLAAQPAGTVAHVCGPAGLVRAVHAAAAALGWPDDSVRSESFAGQPVPGDQAIEVALRRSRRVLRVGPQASVLDTMLDHGIDVLWDCRRGECGLCATPVLESDGALVHRDRCLSPAQREAGDTLCVCVSRTRGKRLVLDA